MKEKNDHDAYTYMYLIHNPNGGEKHGLQADIDYLVNDNSMNYQLTWNYYVCTYSTMVYSIIYKDSQTI